MVLESLHYTQLDFLRLFRLCKECGVIRAKRKMPTEFVKEGAGANACRRLMRAFIGKIFNGFEARNTHEYCQLTIPAKERQALQTLREKNNRWFENLGEEGLDIRRRWQEIGQANHHIRLNFPRSIVVNFMSSNSKWNSLRRRGIPNPIRPKEEFFSAAKECIEWAKLWNEHLPVIIDFLARATEIERERNKKQRAAMLERRKLERERLKLERADDDKSQKERLAKLKALEKEAEKAKRKQQSKAQEAFNKALRGRS